MTKSQCPMGNRSLAWDLVIGICNLVIRPKGPLSATNKADHFDQIAVREVALGDLAMRHAGFVDFNRHGPALKAEFANQIGDGPGSGLARFAVDDDGNLRDSGHERSLGCDRLAGRW